MNAERWVTLLLAASGLASLGLLVIFVLGGQPQVEGILLGVALGGLGVAMVVWGAAFIDAPTEEEPQHSHASSPEARREIVESLGQGQVTRRGFLGWLLGGTVAALGAALAIPVFSLGPMPGRALFRTSWRGGARVVNADGGFLRPEDLALDAVVTVFPEGHIGDTDASTLLVRVRRDELALPEGRADWAPGGVVGYSKLCTHAGCPVGLYRAEAKELLCPCHQSTFDVLRGAVPVFGPAARPLPQLPLEVDAEGFLVARGDFPEPVGPSFWNLTHDPLDEDAPDEGEEG